LFACFGGLTSNFSQLLASVLNELGPENARKCEDFPHFLLLRTLRGHWAHARVTNKHQQIQKDMVQYLLEMLQWREKHGMDTILNTHLPNYREFHEGWPSSVHGQVANRLIYVERLEEQDIDTIYDMEPSELIKLRAQYFELFEWVKLKETGSANGTFMSKAICILDLKGLSITKHFSGKVRAQLPTLLGMGGSYYPESLHRMFVINAPATFR
jgi:hypothetical protein